MFVEIITYVLDEKSQIRIKMVEKACTDDSLCMLFYLAEGGPKMLF